MENKYQLALVYGNLFDDPIIGDLVSHINTHEIIEVTEDFLKNDYKKSLWRITMFVVFSETDKLKRGEHFFNFMTNSVDYYEPNYDYDVFDPAEMGDPPIILNYKEVSESTLIFENKELKLTPSDLIKIFDWRGEYPVVGRIVTLDKQNNKIFIQ